MSERDIFTAAREMTDPVARAAYLDEACGGDPGLRARVEALLLAHDRPDSLLDRPAIAAHDPDPDATQALTGVPGLGVSASQTAVGENTPTDDEALSFLAPPRRSDSLGRIGHYEVLQVLGRGGFGIVFRAFDDVLHRVVAVKVLAPQMAATSPARKRFLREARSSAQVRHENVVQVYEVGEQPLPYIAMEFIPGETLQQRLDRTGPIDVLEVVRIGRQIAEGLAAAHANDLIHRDIKPGNILLEGGQLRVKLTDFGLARAADDASISQSGIIAGTPMFMAPEQAKGESLDQRADLFSLGSVLYVMTSGRPPFRANNTVAVLKRVAEDTPRPIREIIPETPQWLCDIIAKLHAKDPGDRFQSAREVVDVLADCEAQLKANSKLKDFSRIPRSKSQPSGRRKWAAAAVLLLPVIALAITEFAGVSHLFQNQHTTRVPIKLASEPAQATLVGKKDTKPVVAAGKQDEQVIDLMPLARPDLARGNWERQGDTLVCTPTFASNSTLPIPVELPREYELEVELERLALSDFFGLHLAAFGARFHVGVDAFSVQGGWSGLGRIEGKELLENETGIHGLQIIAGKHYILRCMVRATGIRATLDDKLLFHYTGGFEKLGDDAFPDQIHADLYIKVAAHAGFKVHRLRLTRLAPENKTSGSPAGAPTPAIAPFDAAQARAHQGAWAKHLGVPVDFTNSIGMTFMMIPPGKFTMGSSNEEIEFWRERLDEDWYSERLQGEDPPHEVEVTQPFYIGQTEITAGQFRQFVNATGYKTQADRGGGAYRKFPDGGWKMVADLNWLNPGFPQTDDHPAVCVSWNDAMAFCNWLSKQEGKSYRMPTEAEWEYSCRAGSRAQWSFGSNEDELVKYARVFSNSENHPWPVGGLKENAWGLHDMHGNVWEMCQDAYEANYYKASPPKDPPGPDAGEVRVHRGGSGGDAPVCSRSAFRAFHHWDGPSNHVGFRVVLVASPPAGVRTGRGAKGQPSSTAIAPFTDADVRRIASLAAAEQVEEVRKELMRRNPGFDGTVGHNIEGDVVTELRINTDKVTDIAPIRVFGALRVLECGGTITAFKPNGRLKDLTPLKGMNLAGLTHLNLINTKVTDAGMVYFEDCNDLTYLNLANTKVTDGGLAHFKGCKNLTILDLTGTKVTDGGLAHFKGCKNLTGLYAIHTEVGDAGLAHFQDCKALTHLYLAGTQVGDAGLAHFKGMPLMFLWIYDTGITDLSPLQGMPLEDVRLTPKRITRGLDILRDMKSLKTIGIDWNQSWPAAEFWGRYANREFGAVPLTDADVRHIAALPAAEQVEQVRKELMRRNPGFDGKVEHKVEDGVVTDFRIVTDHVTDISPIGSFDSLRALDCGGTNIDKPNGLLADLTPLKGMSLAGLTHLFLGNTKVTDAGLAAFKNCKDLTTLHLYWTNVSDAGLVHFLDCKDLTDIGLAGTKVRDVGLAHFKDCENLTHLHVDHTQVGDAGLARLKGLPLMSLWIDHTAITDLTPLQGMPLEDIRLTPRNITRGMDVLRDMKSLKTIGTDWDRPWPAAEFWERYDKGEFKE